MKRVGTLLTRALFAALLLVAVSAQVASANPGNGQSAQPASQPEDPGTAPDFQPQDPGTGD